jgi:serine/threonine-protein kinase 24/25/MST4
MRSLTAAREKDASKNSREEELPRLLCARFEILEVVGRGTQGLVHRALDHENNKQQVALKLVDLEQCEDDVLDIQNEIRHLAECSSQYVTKYLGSWLIEGTATLAIAMEYMGGGSVLDLISERDGLDERIVRVLLRDVVKALKYLHGEGKIHRDVKCANVLLNENGEVRLADFGVSGQMTQTIGARRKTFAGTPFWMAPEVIQSTKLDEGYDEKADIWSLGITAIECATGSAPHAHLHPMRALFVIPQSAPPELPEDDGEFEGKFSLEFRDFVKKCLRMDPNLRPSAEELLNHPFLAVVGESVGNASEEQNNSNAISTNKTSNSNLESDTTTITTSTLEREEVSTIIAETKHQGSSTEDKSRREISTLEAELTAPADYKEEKTNKIKKKKPPPPAHSPPALIKTKLESPPKEKNDDDDDNNNDNEDDDNTPSTQKMNETQTETPVAGEEDKLSPRSSNSTLSSHKSRPESTGNSSWDFGNGSLGRRYSKKQQAQQQQQQSQQQKNVSPENSNSEYGTPYGAIGSLGSPTSSRLKSASFRVDGESLPRTSVFLRDHVRDVLRELEIPKGEADSVFLALARLENAVNGSVDALFSNVHEKSMIKMGKQGHISKNKSEPLEDRSVLAEYLLSRWRDDLIRDET